MRTCKLGKRGLKAEAEWIEAHRKLVEARFEALDEIMLKAFILWPLSLGLPYIRTTQHA